MPYFIIPTLWAVSMLGCLVLAIAPPLRRLAAVMAVASTGATIGSIGLSLVILTVLIVPDQLGYKPPTILEAIVGLSALIALPVGFALGGLVGLVAARRYIARRHLPKP